MANRPENHITGDKAVRKIEDRLIPEEWTISTPDSDYGLDMLVEVVLDNKTTGKLFFIQAKGTTESSQNGQITYSMDVDRIKDYSEIKLPVLLVYYSKTDDKFWGRWMNYLYETLTDTQKEQKSVTLTFYSYNEIDVDYLKSIGREIDLSITHRTSLYCENLQDQFKQYHNQIITIAKQYIGSDITEDSHLTCQTLSFCYEGCLQDGYVIVIFGKNKICVPIKISSLGFLFYPSLKKEECPDCFLDLIYAIAIGSSQISLQSIDYVLLNPCQNALNLISIEVWTSFIYRLPVDKIKEILELFKLSVQGQCGEIAQAIILIVFIHSINNEENANLYRKLLSLYLSYNKENEIRGRLFYNLANSIKNKDIYEAFSLYVKAIKYEHQYRDKYYWWQEVAGVLYITRHYKIAESFYKKARELNPERCRNDIDILISDCLICQGKIEDALDAEHNYINKLDKLSSVVLLKNNITNMMAKREVSIFDAVYWYNQGISAARDNRQIDSEECFLFAWRLNDGDIEALLNAFFGAFNGKDDAKMAFIISALRERSPIESYKKIVSTILSCNGLNDSAEAVIGLLKQCFESKSD